MNKRYKLILIMIIIGILVFVLIYSSMLTGVVGN